MNLTIRPLQVTDYPALLALFTEFAEYEKHLDSMTNTLEKMEAEHEYINGFGAFNEQGDMIGYATYFFAYYTFIGKSVYMDDLYVKPEYRGLGLGTKLINEVISFARSQNCHKVRWQVSEWNTNSIEFYKSLGAKLDNLEYRCDLIL